MKITKKIIKEDLEFGNQTQEERKKMNGSDEERLEEVRQPYRGFTRGDNRTAFYKTSMEGFPNPGNVVSVHYNDSLVQAVFYHPDHPADLDTLPLPIADLYKWRHSREECENAPHEYTLYPVEAEFDPPKGKVRVIRGSAATAKARKIGLIKVEQVVEIHLLQETIRSIVYKEPLTTEEKWAISNKAIPKDSPLIPHFFEKDSKVIFTFFENESPET